MHKYYLIIFIAIFGKEIQETTLLPKTEFKILQCFELILQRIPHQKNHIYISLKSANHYYTKLLDAIVSMLNPYSLEVHYEYFTEPSYLEYHPDLLLLIFDGIRALNNITASMSRHPNSFVLLLYLGTPSLITIFNKTTHGPMNLRALALNTSCSFFAKNKFGDDCSYENTWRMIDYADIEVYINSSSLSCPIMAAFDEMEDLDDDDDEEEGHEELDLFGAPYNQLELRLLIESARTWNSPLVLHPNISAGGKYTIFFGTLPYTGARSFYPFLTDTLVIVVPPGERRSNWEGLVMVFNEQLWICTIACAIIYVLLALLLQRLNNSKDTISIINFYAIFISQSVKQPRGYKSRIIFIFWCVYSFMILNAYSCFLLSSLVRSTYNPPLDSLEEIAHSDYIICTQESYMPMLLAVVKASKVNFPKSKLQLCEVHDLHHVEDTHVHAMKRSEFEFLLGGELDKHHTVPVYTYPISLRADVDGHPLKEPIDAKIQVFIETGLANKWFADTWSPHNVKKTKVAKGLTLQHVALAFAVLGIGLAMAAGVFGLEIGLRRFYCCKGKVDSPVFVRRLYHNK